MINLHFRLQGIPLAEVLLKQYFKGNLGKKTETNHRCYP